QLSKEGRRLYTTSQTEANDLVTKESYAFDGTPCYVFAAPAFGLAPLFRLDNKAQNDHLLTTSPPEAQQAISQFGYKGQGIAAHVLTAYAPGTVPLFRLSKAD